MLCFFEGLVKRWLMDLEYWDKVSEDYRNEILSVFDDELHGRVKKRIKKLASAVKGGRAADIGCGVGRFTPLLAKYFEKVEACDFSATALRKAKRRCRRLENVAFCQLDLSRGTVPFSPVDFVFCANVLIMPSLDKRLRAWRSVTNQVESGGDLLLVVPSLESVQLEFYDQIETYLDRGYKSGKAVRKSVDEKASASDLRLGVYQLGGVRTKHYLKEELVQMLEVREFEVRKVEKVEYSTESASGFVRWDWLVCARRR